MAETLLSPSNVLLFGRVMEDLTISPPLDFPPNTKNAALTLPDNFDVTQDIPETVDGEKSKGKSRFFLKVNNQHQEQIGIYKRINKTKKLERVELNKSNIDDKDFFVNVKFGSSKGIYSLTGYGTQNAAVSTSNIFTDERHGPFIVPRGGLESQLEQQIVSDDGPRFARIYGFSFEGFYYDLSRPILFLVHGDGEPATEARGRIRRARAPGEPSLTGIGQADFQFSDDIMVWSYDKADYTIRMDVETGMFEDVLLAAMLGGGPGGMDSAGMNARGMNARGMNARGMNARGMNARGMNARGGGNSD